jgi:hypothetical protein
MKYCIHSNDHRDNNDDIEPIHSKCISLRDLISVQYIIFDVPGLYQ